MDLMESELVGLPVTARGKRLGTLALVWGSGRPLLGSLGAGVVVPLTRTRVLPSAEAAEELELDVDPDLVPSAPRTRAEPDEADLALLEDHFGLGAPLEVDLDAPQEPDGPLRSAPARVSPGVSAAALDPGALGAQRFSDHAFEPLAGVTTGPAPSPDLPLSAAGPDAVRAHQEARAERAARDALDHYQTLDLSNPSKPDAAAGDDAAGGATTSTATTGSTGASEDR
jgi:hypothetical protein